MKDKDLQELFEAKRTTEANKLRQEAIRQQIAQLGSATPTTQPRSRRLWPVWGGAVAATVALLLIALPMALRQSQPSSQGMVAQAPEEIPAPTLTTAPAEAPITAPATPSAPLRHTPQRATIHSLPTPSTKVVDSILDATLQPTIEENIPHDTTITEQKEIPQPEPEAPARTIRRSSTLLACTHNCTPQADKHNNESKSLMIDPFSNDLQNLPLTLARR